MRREASPPDRQIRSWLSKAGKALTKNDRAWVGCHVALLCLQPVVKYTMCVLALVKCELIVACASQLCAERVVESCELTIV